MHIHGEEEPDMAGRGTEERAAGRDDHPPGTAGGGVFFSCIINHATLQKNKPPKASTAIGGKLNKEETR